MRGGDCDYPAGTRRKWISEWSFNGAVHTLLRAPLFFPFKAHRDFSSSSSLTLVSVEPGDKWQVRWEGEREGA